MKWPNLFRPSRGAVQPRQVPNRDTDVERRRKNGARVMVQMTPEDRRYAQGLDAQAVRRDAVRVNNMLKRTYSEKRGDEEKEDGEGAYSPMVVADYLLECAKRQGRAHQMSLMKLIKLVYLAHETSIGNGNGPLLDEAPEAWEYGPVVRSLYFDLFRYRSQPLPYPLLGEDRIDYIAPWAKECIEHTVDRFADFTAVELSAITHRPGSAWAKTAASYGKDALIAASKYGVGKGRRKDPAVIISNDMIEHCWQQRHAAGEQAAEAPGGEAAP